MLKRNITYEDFDGNECTDVFYFNISKPELVDIEVGHEGGFESMIRRIEESKDNQALVNEFKRLVLLSYGQKSEDGKRFIKNDQLREEFLQTAAYNSLFMELAINDGAAAEFIKGILPKDMVNEINTGVQDKPIGPPAPSL